MHKSQKKIVTLVSSAVMAATMLLSVSAYAQNDTAASKDSVPMVSGGVGEQELAHMKSVESQYNLKLLFAEVNGVYLAEVSVSIRDAQGHKVVDTITVGPILLVTLPPGSYKVTATEGDETKEQKVSVSSKSLREYVFRFRTRDSETSDDHPL